MNSLVMSVGGRVVQPFMVLVAVSMLLRGHDLPGGGFVGGLILASAFTLEGLIIGPLAMRLRMRLSPLQYCGVGGSIAGLSGVISVVSGKNFLQGIWVEWPLGAAGTIKVGTPVLFDLGIFVLVVGMVTAVMLSLLEDEDAIPA